jgi:predicted Rossmann-fold nucleotide-binding protein
MLTSSISPTSNCSDSPKFPEYFNIEPRSSEDTSELSLIKGYKCLSQRVNYFDLCKSANISPWEFIGIPDHRQTEEFAQHLRAAFGDNFGVDSKAMRRFIEPLSNLIRVARKALEPEGTRDHLSAWGIEPSEKPDKLNDVMIMGQVAQAFQSSDTSLKKAAEMVLLGILGEDFFLGRSEDRYTKILDAPYQQDLILQMQEAPYSNDTIEAGIQLIARIHRCLEQRSQYADFINAFSNVRVVTMFGSARDGVVLPDNNEHVREDHINFARHLARELVTKDISFASGGGPGFMKLFAEIFAEEIARQGKKGSVYVIALPLDLRFPSGSNGIPFEEPIHVCGSIEGPAVRQFPSRTGGLLHVGEEIVSIGMPGGFGTTQEISENLLSQQLGRVALTSHTDRPKSPVILVNTVYPEGGSHGFFEDFASYLDGQVTAGATDPENRALVHLVDPSTSNGRDQAVKICLESLERIPPLTDEQKTENRRRVNEYIKKYNARVPW